MLRLQFAEASKQLSPQPTPNRRHTNPRPPDHPTCPDPQPPETNHPPTAIFADATTRHLPPATRFRPTGYRPPPLTVCNPPVRSQLLNGVTTMLVPTNPLLLLPWPACLARRQCRAVARSNWFGKTKMLRRGVGARTAQLVVNDGGGA